MRRWLPLTWAVQITWLLCCCVTACRRPEAVARIVVENTGALAATNVVLEADAGTMSLEDLAPRATAINHIRVSDLRGLRIGWANSVGAWSRQVTVPVFNDSCTPTLRICITDNGLAVPVASVYETKVDDNASSLDSQLEEYRRRINEIAAGGKDEGGP